MAIEITPARRRELARKHGINEQYLYQCLTGRRNMGAEEACRIELESDGELSRQMLCQGNWMRIWPELAEQSAAQEAA